MFRWIRQLLGLTKPERPQRRPIERPREKLSAPSVAVDSVASALPAKKVPERTAHEATTSKASDASATAPAAPKSKNKAVRQKGENLDRHAHDHHKLDKREAEILGRLEASIQAGHFELPHLPSTSMSLIDMASRPGVEISELVGAIATDPVLSSKLLNTANSVLYAGQVPCETLHQAVLRIGLRALRSMIFSVSMRGAIMREKGLAAYAEEVWRQSYSVASIARKIAPFIPMDPEKAFVLGLLHDIGKVSLLAMLRREIKKDGELSQALIGRAFFLHHESAGLALAKEWNLPEELTSVAGKHHDFEHNTEHPRSAALCKLAHKLDLFASLDAESAYRALINSPEMNFLGIAEGERHRLLEAARAAYFADAAVLTV